MSLDEIRTRTENTPALSVRLADENGPAAIHELEDGLEMLVSVPAYYPEGVQNSITAMFTDMKSDREALLAALDAGQKLLDDTARQYRSTAGHLQQRVLNGHPNRDPEGARRYDSFATAWELAAKRIRAVVAEALGGE